MLIIVIHKIKKYLKENGYNTEGEYIIGTYVGKEIFHIKNKR